MQYSIIQDMQDEFLRVNQRQLQIINANKGVALEGPFSVVAGAFKAIIDAFKSFVARVVGWFKGIFGGKNSHSAKSANAMDKIIAPRYVSTGEKFFSLQRKLTEETCTAWLTTTVPAVYKSKIQTNITESGPYFDEYCDIALADKLSTVMTQSLGLSLFAVTNSGPAHVPDIYKYGELAVRLKRYTHEVFKVMEEAGKITDSGNLTAITNVKDSLQKLIDFLLDRSDGGRETSLIEQVTNMRAVDATGLEDWIVKILASGSQRVNTGIFRIPSAYRSYCETKESVAKIDLSGNLTDFTKLAEKHTHLVQLVQLVTEAVKNAMAATELTKAIADSGLATVTAYVEERMLHNKEMYALLVSVMGTEKDQALVMEASAIAGEIEESLASDKKYLQELK